MKHSIFWNIIFLYVFLRGTLQLCGGENLRTHKASHGFNNRCNLCSSVATGAGLKNSGANPVTKVEWQMKWRYRNCVVDGLDPGNERWGTPPKFNSSPLKSYRFTQKEKRVFQALFFRGELLNFGRVRLMDVKKNIHPQILHHDLVVDSLGGCFSSDNNCGKGIPKTLQKQQPCKVQRLPFSVHLFIFCRILGGFLYTKVPSPKKRPKRPKRVASNAGKSAAVHGGYHVQSAAQAHSGGARRQRTATDEAGGR